MIKQFFHCLESYLRREIIDNNEKQAYIQVLFILQSLSIVLSSFFNNNKTIKKQ